MYMIKTMKRLLLIIISAWLSSNVFCHNTGGGNYYVDCSASTNGNGSLKNPWNTLASVNRFTFKPGDSVLFKRGTVAYGELWPKGSGNENA